MKLVFFDERFDLKWFYFIVRRVCVSEIISKDKKKRRIRNENFASKLAARQTNIGWLLSS